MTDKYEPVSATPPPGAPAPSSTSPSVDQAAKRSAIGLPQGIENPQEILKQKHTNHPIDPGSVKK